MGRASECHGPWLSRWMQRDGPNYRRSSACSSSVGVILQNQSINKYPASVPSVQAPSWQNTLQFWRQVDVLGNAISYRSVFFLSSTASPGTKPPPSLLILLHPYSNHSPPNCTPHGTCSLLLFLSFLERESLQSRFCVSLATLILFSPKS